MLKRYLTLCTLCVFAAVGRPVPCLMAQEKEPQVRQPPSAADIAVPPDYGVEVFAANLSYPVDIAFGDDGEAYVAEAGGHTYGTKPEAAPPARILQLLPNGERKVIYDRVVPLDVIRKAEFGSTDLPEGLIMPVTGLTWHDGKLYVAHRSRYSTLDPATGEFKTIIDGLPCWGEFLNAKAIFGPDGKMVFFISTQGNSGVIESHWIKVIRTFHKPGAHEIPGEDVTLRGINYAAPKEPGKPKETVPTGVYVPLGTTTELGQVIAGQKICNGAFYRAEPDGSNIERICWGLRSCFGYRFSPEGTLVTTQNSGNPMPPRGIRYDLESIYAIEEGLWYGWPDYFSGIPITDPRFEVREGPQEFVLTQETHQELLQGTPLPPQPIAKLPVHSAAEGMVFGRRDFGVADDHILVAEMGCIVPLYKYDERRNPAWPLVDVELEEEWPPDSTEYEHGVDPGIENGAPAQQKPAQDQRRDGQTRSEGKLPPREMEGIHPWPGFRVSLVDLQTGNSRTFMGNKSGKPASVSKGGGIERPIQLEWGPDGELYVVDFGVIEFSKKGMKAHPNTGIIWRVMRTVDR